MKTAFFKIVALLFGCLLLFGCSAKQTNDVSVNPTTALTDALAAPPAQDQTQVRLYFRYQDSAYLAAEEREMTVSHGDTAEKAVVQALLQGPEAGSVSLASLFPPDVQVLSTALQGDTLFVTFNEALLGRYPDEPGGIGNEEFILRRKLCMAALVNTLTEAGFCARVQVLVDRETTAVTSLRLPQSFYRDSEDETPLGPMYRDESVILTPYNTARMILDAWMRRSNAQLYTHVASVGSDLTPRPGSQQAYEAFDAAPVLTSFTLSPGVVSKDGKSAILSADLVLRYMDNDVTVTSYPLRLTQENGLWKIPYDQLTQLLNAAN